ncbi:MAG: hypothetical protein NC308_03175 [Clostridium sp.]|nr:hypothetical protein [Bacteroides sp.]MCM1197867.1 hypothetical protein [Clostridium sp.]
MKSKGRDSFWPSYVDVMITLFAIMVVLFAVSYSRFRVEEDKLKKIVSKYEEIQSIYKVVENIDSTYFEFNSRYVKHIFRIQVTYQKGKFMLDELEDDLTDRKAADAMRQQIIAAGREIQKTILTLQDTSFTKQDIKYLVVIEGQASADGYHVNDYYNNDVLSFQRALALHRFWKDAAGIDFSDMSKCELVISGSGEGGVPRYTEKDYIESHHQTEPELISASDWEKYNQRFLIHIVPVIGNIRMTDS